MKVDVIKLLIKGFGACEGIRYNALDHFPGGGEMVTIDSGRQIGV